MKCELSYCIYNKNNICLLDEIEVNSAGQCDACIIVSFPEDKLDEYKQKQLKDITERNKEPH